MADAPRTAEALQQFGAFSRADTGNLLEPARSGANTGTARPHSGDRKAMRFVADLRDEHERRRLAAEPDLGPPIGEDELLEPDLAPFALLDADDARKLDAEFLEHFFGDADLALAAVDENNVGQPRRALARRLDEFGVAARQHLAHRRVIVARRDTGDVVAAVLRTLHLVRLEDNAGALSRLAGRVADVETFDTKRVQILDGDFERLDQGAGARLLRALLGKQLRQAQGRALDAHVEPGPTLLTRLVLHRHLHSCLRGKRLDERLVDGVADHEQGWQAAFEVLLGDESLEDAYFARLLMASRCIVIDRLDVDADRRFDVLRKIRPVAEMTAVFSE